MSVLSTPMVAPTTFKTRWIVWTDNQNESWEGRNLGPLFFWQASGPRGHKTGAEYGAEAAMDKAHAAVLMLADPERTR